MCSRDESWFLILWTCDVFHPVAFSKVVVNLRKILAGENTCNRLILGGFIYLILVYYFSSDKPKVYYLKIGL